jgi:hypothetical protein
LNAVAARRLLYQDGISSLSRNVALPYQATARLPPLPASAHGNTFELAGWPFTCSAGPNVCPPSVEAA